MALVRARPGVVPVPSCLCPRCHRLPGLLSGLEVSLPPQANGRGLPYPPAHGTVGLRRTVGIIFKTFRCDETHTLLRQLCSLAAPPKDRKRPRWPRSRTLSGSTTDRPADRSGGPLRAPVDAQVKGPVERISQQALQFYSFQFILWVQVALRSKASPSTSVCGFPGSFVTPPPPPAPPVLVRGRIRPKLRKSRPMRSPLRKAVGKSSSRSFAPSDLRQRSPGD